MAGTETSPAHIGQSDLERTSESLRSSKEAYTKALGSQIYSLYLGDRAAGMYPDATKENREKTWKDIADAASSHNKHYGKLVEALHSNYSSLRNKFPDVGEIHTFGDEHFPFFLNSTSRTMVAELYLMSHSYKTVRTGTSITYHESEARLFVADLFNESRDDFWESITDRKDIMNVLPRYIYVNLFKRLERLPLHDYIIPTGRHDYESDASEFFSFQ